MEKWAKYLPEFGWEPIVVTVEPRTDMYTRHGALPDELRRGKVYRTRDLSLNEFLYSWASRFRTQKGVSDGGGYKSPSTLHRFGLRIGSFAYRLYKQLICFPDEAVPWLLEYPKIERITQKERPDVVLSSSLPNTCHIIASRLSRRLRLPWVADFRDLWTQNHAFRRIFPLRLLEVWLEKRTIAHAAALITVSEPLKDQLESLHRKPVFVIPNGFDPDDFPEESISSNPDGPLLIVYTGMIYPGKRDPSPLFAALSVLLRRGKISSGDVRVDFYGRKLDVVLDLLERYPEVKDMVQLRGEVSHEEAMKAQRAADVLLLLGWTDPQARGIYTGKVFEYLGAKRPILSIGPEGDVIEELLNETKAGVHLKSVESIASWLERWLQEKKVYGAPAYQGDEEVILRYTRREQTQDLSKTLDFVIKL
ncbi:glycosyltransferase [Thermosulfurimonas sp. F29]|nr:glycosyltransferase [Thermosulfurimonas sp. F29]